MRRAIWAAVIGLFCATEAAQAGGWYDFSPPYGASARYGGYGRQLRGGYGVNGYAPWHGPVWGPNAFIYANGQAVDPRPHGSYVRPLFPPDMLAPQDVLFPPPVAPEEPPVPMTESEAK